MDDYNMYGFFTQKKVKKGSCILSRSDQYTLVSNRIPIRNPKYLISKSPKVKNLNAYDRFLKINQNMFSITRDRHENEI
jgi:hypothetical protein